MFIVKHKPTGKYLPPLKSGKNATGQPLSESPRIFQRKQDAVGAARWWSDGVSWTHRVQDWEGDWDQEFRTTPKSDRKIEDLEIIPITLTHGKGEAVPPPTT